MDILGMLQGDLDELCLEDIEMMTEELNVGNYSEDYIRQSMLFINRFKRSLMKKTKGYGSADDANINNFLIDNVPDGNDTENIRESSLTRLQIFQKGLEEARKKPDYLGKFMQFLEHDHYNTEECVDEYFNEFNSDEISVLLINMQFSENFLDKYFDFLNHGNLAMYQLYSEAFFMKHFADMKPQLVLVRSKNEWRTKAKRSKKLETFLRLKGVKI